MIKPTGPNANTIIKDTLLEHSCRTFLGVTFVGHLLKSLAIARHPTVSGPFLASAPIPPNCIRCTATKRPSLGKKMQRGQRFKDGNSSWHLLASCLQGTFFVTHQVKMGYTKCSAAAWP